MKVETRSPTVLYCLFFAVDRFDTQPATPLVALHVFNLISVLSVFGSGGMTTLFEAHEMACDILSCIEMNSLKLPCISESLEKSCWCLYSYSSALCDCCRSCVSHFVLTNIKIYDIVYNVFRNEFLVVVVGSIFRMYALYLVVMRFWLNSMAYMG